MRACALIPLRECANLRILSAFILYKIFEKNRITVSFLVISESPFLGSVISLLTGVNCVTLPPNYFHSHFASAWSLAVKGSELVVILFPGFDFERWFLWITENNLQAIVSISGTNLNDFERFCADQIFKDAGIIKAVLDFTEEVFSFKTLKLKGFTEVIPQLAYAEYHFPKYDYSYLQNFVNQIDNFSIEINSALTGNYSMQEGRNLKAHVCFTEDAYFNFTFKENLVWLTKNGCKVSTISPVLASDIPSSVDLLWITGGNIFDFLKIVQGNKKFLRALADYLRAGKAVYCEGLSSAVLCEDIDFGGENIRGLGYLDLNAIFTLRSGRFCELRQSSRYSFGAQSVCGFNLPQFGFLCSVELTNFYYRFLDNFDIVITDFFLPARNVLLTTTYVPLYLNEKFSYSLLRWAKNCSAQ